MKKYCLALLALAYISCGSPENAHTHDDHEHTAHDHEHEGHDHDHEGHDHDHEGHDHEHGSETKVHSDEVIFTKEQASMGDFALEKVTKGNKNRRTGNIIPSRTKRRDGSCLRDSPFGRQS